MAVGPVKGVRQSAIRSLPHVDEVIMANRLSLLPLEP